MMSRILEAAWAGVLFVALKELIRKSCSLRRAVLHLPP